MKNEFDLIIIGGGPAGISAAIYAKRANLNVTIIEESQDGGKLSKISKIDNYPGFSSISGFDLSQQFLLQLKQYDVNIINEKVIKIDNNTIITSENAYQAKAILIATGSKQKKLDIVDADKYEGNGISYCAICDGFFFRKKDVVVIGDNSQALQESLYLANIVNTVTIVNRQSNFNCETSLIDKINNTKNIKTIFNSIPSKLIINDNKISGIQIQNIDTNQYDILDCVGIFPYISFNPSTDFVNQSILDEQGYIITNQDMSTSIPGIFAAGDCIKKQLRQIVTACADGAIAATSIIKYIKQK